MIWIAIIVNAILYRLGGWKYGPGKWVRRFIIPIINILAFIFIFKLNVEWYAYLLYYPICMGMLTTYWDGLFEYDNFWFHGFTIGLATLAIAIFGGVGIFFSILYSLLLAVLMGAWCAIFKNDWVEELGRGSFILLAFWLVRFIVK